MTLGASEYIRRTLGYARAYAVGAGHTRIGSEHLMWGILQNRTCAAVEVLHALNIDTNDLSNRLTQLIAQLPEFTNTGGSDTLCITGRARRAFEYALCEAHALAQDVLSPEHLMLGILIQEESCASQLLTYLGVTPENVRHQLISMYGLKPNQVKPITDPQAQIDAAQSEQLGLLIRSFDSPHLPPLSETGRKVRRLLTWGTPLLIFISLPCVLLWRDTQGRSFEGVQVFMSIYIVPVLLWLLFLAFFRLQAHILELTIVLAVCSMPVGIALNMNETEETLRWLTGTVGLILLAGGSVWGLSIAQRTGEQRTFPRLAYIVLGWTLCPGVMATYSLAVSVFDRKAFLMCAWHYLLAVALIVGMIIALVVESRCAKKYGPMQVW